MSDEEKIYEGTVGFVFDIELEHMHDLLGDVVNQKLLVQKPDGTEEDWPVTIEMEEKVFRHVVPENKPLLPGTYRFQPYLEYGYFKGPWGTVRVKVHRRFS